MCRAAASASRFLKAPRIGEFVTLQVDRGDAFEAQIRWVLGIEAGGVFLTPIDQGAWN